MPSVCEKFAAAAAIGASLWFSVCQSVAQTDLTRNANDIKECLDRGPGNPQSKMLACQRVTVQLLDELTKKNTVVNIAPPTVPAPVVNVPAPVVNMKRSAVFIPAVGAATEAIAKKYCEAVKYPKFRIVEDNSNVVSGFLCFDD